MSAVQNDTVKVTVAMIAPKGDHSALTMTTTDGMTVEFFLDDMAISLLGLTYQSALMGAKARKDAGKNPTIFERTSE